MNPLDNKKVMELTGGLKNALERGETLEEAIQSLKNAGYNEGVVIEASKKLKITLEGDEEKKEIPQKKQKNNFFGLRKLFSRKPKTENQKPIPQKITPPPVTPRMVTRTTGPTWPGPWGASRRRW